MRPPTTDVPHSGLDKKRTVVLLRSVVVVSTSYLVLFAHPAASAAGVAYVLTLLLSNVVLAALPAHLFDRPNFSAAVLLGDTAAVLVGLYHTVGFSQDFLIVYFFTIFLTTASGSLWQIAVGAGIVSGLYGYWLWLSSGHGLGAGEWLRLPFFFIIAVFYAYLTEGMKYERRRREAAEEETRHLRFLLGLSDTFSKQIANRELVAQLGALVEAAFPRLRCAVRLDPEAVNIGDGACFPIAAHGTAFGALNVTSADDAPLRPEEEQCCRGVALAAGNALYTADQVSAAESGARVKDEFLGVLSHELRTPLHAIMGYVEMLECAMGDAADEFARESIERLRANSCRLQDLIEEMLCFVELRAGKCALQIERVDLRELFEQCGGALTELLAGRPIRFEVEVDAAVPVMQTDRRKVRQLISGLLSNAAKFTERGFVRLAATRCGDAMVEISVADSGIGIAAKNLAVIFDTFRQIDTSLTRQFGGVGLGLSLTRELAYSLGGRVAVESEPNRGTTFRVRLPLVSQEPEATTQSAGAAVFASLRPALEHPQR